MTLRPIWHNLAMGVELDIVPMAERDGSQELPDLAAATVIRAALQRVLASDAFRGAPQLSAFLSFIVERHLEGRTAEVKGYTIAVEAFGRAADFDPQSDPIVRVEAGRLRRALSQYYAGEGSGDPVRIAMPVGAYVPDFEGVAGQAQALAEGEARQAPAAGAGAARPEAFAARSPAPPAADGAASRRWVMAVAAALVIGLAALFGWLALGSRPTPGRAGIAPTQAELTVEAVRQARAGAPAHLPVVVLTLTENATEPALTQMTRDFARLLVDVLARFDDMIVVRALGDGGVVGAADYAFEMSATKVGDVTEGFGRLRSLKDDRIVWSTSTSRNLQPGGDASQLQEVARRLAIRLAEPFGIIQADFRQNSPSPVVTCLFKAFNFRRTMLAKDHLAARTCIEAVIEQDPGFHPAWSQLALLILDEYSSGLNPQPGPPLDRALSAALTAVRLAPSSARARQVMMDVQFARGAVADAIRSGQEAIGQNPYDPDIMADLGARYVQLNRPAEGLPLLRRAVELSAGRPPWYDFFAFLAAHLLGADKEAGSHATNLLADESLLSLLGRALAHAKAGEEAMVVSLLALLAKRHPLLPADARLYLGRRGFSDAVIDRILLDLGPAGRRAVGLR